MWDVVLRVQLSRRRSAEGSKLGSEVFKPGPGEPKSAASNRKTTRRYPKELAASGFGLARA